jgi:6-phosphogluconolactonase (cycloisomerase 2 family)
MAITNALNAPRNSYTSTAGQTAFAVGFEFYQVTDVKVYKNGSLMTYNAAPSNTVTYSITGTASAGDSAYEFGGGGSVVFGSGLTNGDVIVIVRDIAVERTVDFNPSSAFDITTLNTQLDTIIGMIADREKQGDRSVKLLDTDIVAATVTLPLKATRASKVLSFDADGNTETTITSTGLSALNSVTSEIGLLGTSANVTAMGLLGTSAVIADMALLGTTDAIADMALLATSDIVSDLNTLATSDIVADLAILATSDIVSDINTLATSDIVSDLNTLATSAIVTDLSILATSDIVTDINLLATSDIVSDLNTLATSDFVSDLNTLASSTVVTNIATVASNVAGVNSFAARYRVTGGDPGSDNDAGDLNYNTSSNALKYWNGSAWTTIASSYSIDTATDTNLTSVADGAMLLYDTGTSKWIDNVMSGDATMADTGVITIANDAVTADKIADSINSAITANTAKVTNATHTGEVTGATALTIADNIVDEANLKVSNAPTNGYFLSAQSGNTGGLTWAEAGGGGFSFNAVTGATPSLNLGSYNFFDRGATSANTTVSFASVPTEARWTYTFKVGAGTETWDVSKASFEKSFSIQPEEPQNRGLFFKTDGTAMYTIGDTTDTVHQYTLSTAWDVATASYASKEFDVSGQENSPRDLFFKPDGTIMYTVGNNADRVNQWTLSTAWDVSTASYASKYISYASQSTAVEGLFFKPDGVTLYILGENNNTVFQYTLSTAWDISTASYASKSFSVGSQDTGGSAVHFKSDGTAMFVVGTVSDNVFQYTLSTAWDVSTASYASKTIYVGNANTTQPMGMFFKSDGSKMYITGYISDAVSQYNMGLAHTLTLPSSVENPPRIPLQFGSRFAYDFFTKDGGTTVTLLSENKEDTTF